MIDQSHRWRGSDPRKGLTRAEIEAMCELYRTSHMSVREVARHCNVSQERMFIIINLEKCPLRGKNWALKRSRPRLGLKGVFGGMAPVRLAKPASEALEKAKTILRKQGRVVFDATVDGSGPKGFVKCDGRLFTAEQIIQRAAQ
jgi:hypothetical protein